MSIYTRRISAFLSKDGKLRQPGGFLKAKSIKARHGIIAQSERFDIHSNFNMRRNSENIFQVQEETGFDITPYFLPDAFVDLTMKDQSMRLYLVPHVPSSTIFSTQTRKEISVSSHDVFLHHSSKVECCSL